MELNSLLKITYLINIIIVYLDTLLLIPLNPPESKISLLAK